MLEIGTLKLKSNLILAPMAGVTDFPFRMLNRRFGCELAFVEMINSHSVSYKSKRTQKMLFSLKDERPLGVNRGRFYFFNNKLEPSHILHNHQDIVNAIQHISTN